MDGLEGNANLKNNNRTNKVTVLEVEAVQLVASLLRIHDVLIDNERSAFCVCGDTLPDLAIEGVSEQSIESEGRCRCVPNGPKLAEEVEEFLWCNVIAKNCELVSGRFATGGDSRLEPRGRKYLRFFTNKALSMSSRLAFPMISEETGELERVRRRGSRRGEEGVGESATEWWRGDRWNSMEIFGGLVTYRLTSGASLPARFIS